MCVEKKTPSTKVHTFQSPESVNGKPGCIYLDSLIMETSVDVPEAAQSFSLLVF